MTVGFKTSALENVLSKEFSSSFLCPPNQSLQISCLLISNKPTKSGHLRDVSYFRDVTHLVIYV